MPAGHCFLGATRFFNMDIALHLQQYSLPLVLTLALLALSLKLNLFRPANYFQDLTGVNGAKYFNVDFRNPRFTKQNLLSRLKSNSGVNKIPLYPNGWFSILESDEIDVNQVKHVEALGENFAVFRTFSGRLNVIDACCDHLGVHVGISGMVKKDYLQCPFHGLEFDAETKKYKESMNTKKVLDLSRLRNWKSREVNHNIFVWYHSEEEEPTYELEPIPDVESGAYHYVGRFEFLIGAHIEDGIQNVSDYAHFQELHAPRLLIAEKSLDSSWLNCFSSVFKIDVIPSWRYDPDNSHVSWFRLEGKFRIFKKLQFFNIGTETKQVGPSFLDVCSTTRIGNARGVMCFTPIGPFKYKQTMRIYTPPYGGLFGRLFLYFVKITTLQDVMVFDFMKIKPQLNGVKEDGPLLQFRRWYEQFYSENSRGFIPGSELSL